jgi:titin
MSAGSVVKTVPSVPSATTTTLTFPSLADGTSFYFRVTAFDTSGNQSDFCDLPLEVSTFTPPPQPPTAPGGLALTALSKSQIKLNWTDSTRETGYRVERSLDGVSFSTVTSALTANTTTYTDSGLLASTQYYYRVFAKNAVGETVSAVVNATTLSPQPPTAPGSLALTVLSSSQIRLNWTDAAGETTYRVERSLDNVTFTTVTNAVSANAVTYTNTGLAASTLYYYRVAAVNADGEAMSGTQSATTDAPPLSPPTTPTGLSTVSLSSSSVSLSWNNVTGEDSFTVQRSLSQSSGFAQVGTTGMDMTTFNNNTGLSSGTTYFYRILAVNGAGASTSTVISALTMPGAPAAPGAVAASTGSITVTWGNVTGEDGYLIERSLSLNSGYAQVASVGRNVTSYPDGGLQAGTYYYYRVRAFNASGNSPYTAAVYAQTQAVVGGSGIGSVPAGLKEAYAFPNPARGVDPVLRGFMGGVDEMEVTIFDAAGRVVHSGKTSYAVNVNGETAFEYTWTGKKSPGVYYAVMHGKHGDQVIRARAKFAVVR